MTMIISTERGPFDINILNDLLEETFSKLLVGYLLSIYIFCKYF